MSLFLNKKWLNFALEKIEMAGRYMSISCS